MHEVIWQYDENAPEPGSRPASPTEARQLLLGGNTEFARVFAEAFDAAEDTRHVFQLSRHDVGLGHRPGEAPRQEPFAAFLSCADARVPVELIFGQRANDLFVVRVAGNVLGREALGSLDFAVNTLGSVQLLAVLGHTACGAVTGAVDAYLSPAAYLSVAANFPLQAIISAIMGPVRGAADALKQVHGSEVTGRPGYRRALIEMAVIVNAALTASVLARTYRDRPEQHLGIVFAVYDLRRRTVGLPGPDGWQEGLFEPPADQDGFTHFGHAMAGSKIIRDLILKN